MKVNPNDIYKIEMITNIDGSEKIEEKAIRRIGVCGRVLYLVVGWNMMMEYQPDDAVKIGHSGLTTSSVISITQKFLTQRIMVCTQNSVYYLRKVSKGYGKYE